MESPEMQLGHVDDIATTVQALHDDGLPLSDRVPGVTPSNPMDRIETAPAPVVAQMLYFG